MEVTGLESLKHDLTMPSHPVAHRQSSASLSAVVSHVGVEVNADVVGRGTTITGAINIDSPSESHKTDDESIGLRGFRKRWLGKQGLVDGQSDPLDSVSPPQVSESEPSGVVV